MNKVYIVVAEHDQSSAHTARSPWRNTAPARECLKAFGDLDSALDWADELNKIFRDGRVPEEHRDVLGPMVDWQCYPTDITAKVFKVEYAIAEGKKAPKVKST